MLPKKIVYDWLELQNSNNPFVNEFYDRVRGIRATCTTFGFSTDRRADGLFTITVIENYAYFEIDGHIGREFTELFGDNEVNRKYVCEWFFNKFENHDYIKRRIDELSKNQLIFE